jgi:bacillopeptidase F
MKQRFLKPILAFTLCFCLLPLSSMAAQNGKIDPFLKSKLTVADFGEKIPAIVRMKNPLAVQPLATPSSKKGVVRAQARANLIHALKDRAKQNRQPLQKLLNRLRIVNSRQLWLINGMALQATSAQIEEISQMPDVASIAADQIIELPKLKPAQASEPVKQNIAQLNVPSLWSLGYAGQGVTVAVVDSGVDIDHPDLGQRWRGGSNSWFDPNGEHPIVPADLDGHGTHVTGLVLGGNNSGAYIGVAPDAEWIGVKIFTDAGLALSSSIHAGFQWLLDPDQNPETDDAPDIINNSWGFNDEPNVCNDLSKEFQDDIQVMKAAGMAVLFAAGNTGPEASTSTAPANNPESFAVGSVGTSTSPSLISSFSARGPSACDGTIYPEVVAPGFLTWTSDLTTDGIFPNPYIMVSGTSFSTAHASGVMALLLSAFPETPVSVLETALKQSATDLGTPGGDNTYGYGLIDSLSAFNFLSGRHDINVTDSISPENDRDLAFGSVAPGGRDTASFLVRNSSSVPLTLGGTDLSNVREPFSLISDNCSSRILPSGETCFIVLQFAPTVPESFSGSIDILSNAVGEERVTVTFSGIGNTPPVAPQPLSPASGATEGNSVTFTWLPASDPDGDAVTQFLVYSPHDDFSFPIMRQVETVPAIILAAGGLLLAPLLSGLTYRRKLLLGLIFVALFLAMVSCGGGGGDNTELPIDKA